MVSIDNLQDEIKKLSPMLQRQVLALVERLRAQPAIKPPAEPEEKTFDEFSLQAALRGMESERTDEYSAQDLKVLFS